jgi:hypothetical protein
MIQGYRDAEARTSDVEEVLQKFGALSTEEKERFWQLAKRR